VRKQEEQPVGQKMDLSYAAHTKIVCHATKFPFSTVVGLLVGKSDSGNVQITDIVPVFHSNANLSPLMEVALEQVQLHCDKHHLTLLGLYQANQNMESTPSSTVKIIAGQMQAKNAPGVILMVVGRLEKLRFIVRSPFPEINEEVV
jgi:hypothetical protein